MRAFPDFVIAGAAKSGTTTLADMLKQHPDIFIPTLKEPFYYTSGFGLSQPEQYASLFRLASDNHVCGEATTGYLFETAAAERINHDNPAAKIIIILRNPLDMAFSFWQYNRTHGYEDEDFEASISLPVTEYRKGAKFREECPDWWANYLYLDRARYYRQVRDYFQIFGDTNVRVFVFERFIQNPAFVCGQIFKFLGVDSDFLPTILKSNEGGSIRFALLRSLRNRRYPLLRKLLPVSVRASIRRFTRDINVRRGCGKVTMTLQTRQMCREALQSDVGRLRRLMEDEFSEWDFT